MFLSFIWLSKLWSMKTRGEISHGVNLLSFGPWLTVTIAARAVGETERLLDFNKIQLPFAQCRLPFSALWAGTARVLVSSLSLLYRCSKPDWPRERSKRYLKAQFSHSLWAKGTYLLGLGVIRLLTYCMYRRRGFLYLLGCMLARLANVLLSKDCPPPPPPLLLLLLLTRCLVRSRRVSSVWDVRGFGVVFISILWSISFCVRILTCNYVLKRKC